MPISAPAGSRKPRNCPDPAPPPSRSLVAFRAKGDMCSITAGMRRILRHATICVFASIMMWTFFRNDDSAQHSVRPQCSAVIPKIADWTVVPLGPLNVGGSFQSSMTMAAQIEDVEVAVARAVHVKVLKHLQLRRCGRLKALGR